MKSPTPQISEPRIDPPGSAPGSAGTAPVRLGAVSYLNTLPLIEGLEKLKDVELTLRPPSELIGELLSGRVDAALAPVIDAQLGTEPLALLPCGMIGCDGPTLTVRLSSDRPLNELERVRVDSESHTSVVLMRIILKRMHGVEPALEVVDGQSLLRGDDAPSGATLLIGDKVITGAETLADAPIQLDLGEAWKEMTGLPFVYAVWMCRASQVDAPNIDLAMAVLDRQRLHNRTRLDRIARTRGPEHDWPTRSASEYLGRMLRYEVGPREREAIERFYDEAADLGMIERSPTVWVDRQGVT